MASYPTPPRPRGAQEGRDPRAEQTQTAATAGAGTGTTRAGAPNSAAKTTSTRSTSTKRGTLAARPTEARIQSYLATVQPLPGSEARPTESQLRWAAFHSRSKARYTRSLVEALMASPAGVGDVPGALGGDGDTTEESCSSGGEGGGGSSAEGEESGSGGGIGSSPASLSAEAHSNGNLQQKHGRKTNNNKKKKKKRRKKKRRPGQPDLSRGRRATLRVSERATDQRRHGIAKSGVIGWQGALPRVPRYQIP